MNKTKYPKTPNWDSLLKCKKELSPQLHNPQGKALEEREEKEVVVVVVVVVGIVGAGVESFVGVVGVVVRVGFEEKEGMKSEKWRKRDVVLV